VKHRSAIIAAIVGVAAAALVVLFAISPKGEEGSSAGASPLVGKLAPQLAGTTADGQSFDLDRHRGEWVLVNFFATWCPPCVKEHPELVKLSETSDDVQVVSVAAGDSADKVTEFFAENGGDWPVLVTDTDSASIDYGLIKLPESYLISPDGTVVEKFVGGITAEQVKVRVAQESQGSAGTSGPGTSGSGS